MLYNISSLRAHIEDPIDYISTSFPTVWAFTGLHFDDSASYQLASHFKSRYTIYYQRGSNSFGVVCLAISHELPHRLVSKFQLVDNLTAADLFLSNQTYTLAVVYSPPAEPVPIDLFDRLCHYNRALLLVGDLNARHPDWHDVKTNPCGHRLAAWIAASDDLKVFNPSQPTSTRSRAIIDLIIAPSDLSSELATVDQTMCVTDHYPIHWSLSSIKLPSNVDRQVKRVDWLVVNCILTLTQTFFFSLAEQLKSDSVEFIVLYKAFLVALQERCTTYHRVNCYRPSLPLYLVNLIKQRRQVLCHYRSIRSDALRTSLHRLNKYIHHELKPIKRAQWQEFCLGLEPKNTHRFWNHSKRLFKKCQPRIQGFLDATQDRVLTDSNSMVDHAYQYYSEAFQERATPTQNQQASTFREHLADRLAELPSSPFLFAVGDLHRSFRRLKTKTSSGHEKVSNKLLKSIPISHYCFLLDSFNRFLLANTFPQHWKLSKMILLPKQKSTILPVDQTRPISLLPCLSKVYERCFLVYLLRWMRGSGILPPE